MRENLKEKTKPFMSGIKVWKMENKIKYGTTHPSVTPLSTQLTALAAKESGYGGHLFLPCGC